MRQLESGEAVLNVRIEQQRSADSGPKVTFLGGGGVESSGRRVGVGNFPVVQVSMAQSGMSVRRNGLEDVDTPLQAAVYISYDDCNPPTADIRNMQ